MPYSKQGKFIRIATLSPVSHCGIIVMRDGKPYVLETLKTLRLTPLDQFIKRGWKGLYWVKRPWRSMKDKKVAYKKYLGLPYDSTFKLDNGIYYCSELIWEVYEQQFGIKLCRPRPSRRKIPSKAPTFRLLRCWSVYSAPGRCCPRFPGRSALQDFRYLCI